MSTDLRTAGFYLFQIHSSLIERQGRVQKWIYNNSDKIMLAAGVVLVVSSRPLSAMAQGEMDAEPIERVIKIILNDMIGGAFGALIMIVAGLVAIISSAMGAYRAGMSALVVAVGAFVLRSVVSAFWPEVDTGF